MLGEDCLVWLPTPLAAGLVRSGDGFGHRGTARAVPVGSGASSVRGQTRGEGIKCLQYQTFQLVSQNAMTKEVFPGVWVTLLNFFTFLTLRVAN